MCEKEKYALEYKTHHMPQLNGVTERIFTVIEAVVFAMIINAKLNDTDQKMMWSEVVHMYEGVQNSMDTTGSTEIPFIDFHEEKSNIIGSFSEFGII